ncbi:MAG: malonyl-CoA decarboxylase domain-containing protein [Pseudoclavibacter sp.]
MTRHPIPSLAAHNAPAASERDRAIRGASRGPGNHDRGVFNLRETIGLREGIERRADLIADGTSPADEQALRAILSNEFAPSRLVVREISAADPPALLGWIVRHEVVHPIVDDAALLRRLEPADRVTFGLFHPELPDEPVAFTSVALASTPVDSIDELLAADRSTERETVAVDTAVDSATPTIAVFYSIQTCHAGLRGLGLGRTMIAEARAALMAANPSIRHTVTLSPAPTLRAWLTYATVAEAASDGDAATAGSPASTVSRALAAGEHPPRALLDDLAERFVVDATARRDDARDQDSHRRASGRGGDAPRDPVARFHLGNGASLDRALPGAALSPLARDQSYGVMMSYRYDGKTGQ